MERAICEMFGFEGWWKSWNKATLFASVCVFVLKDARMVRAVLGVASVCVLVQHVFQKYTELKRYCWQACCPSSKMRLMISCGGDDRGLEQGHTHFDLHCNPALKMTSKSLPYSDDLVVEHHMRHWRVQSSGIDARVEYRAL